MIHFLPRDARARLRVPWYLHIILKTSLAWVRLTGVWKYPRRFDPDKRSIINDIYWIYKTITPIKHPEKNSNLLNIFRQEQTKPVTFLPPEFEKEATITLSAVGDLMNGMGIANSKDRFYSQVATEIFDANISIGNLESTLTTKKIDITTYSRENKPLINSTLEEFTALTHHHSQKYTILMLGNNHILDRGREGILTTLQQLKRDEMAYFGVNLTAEEAKRALIYSYEGIKIGIIGFTYSVNNRPFPENQTFLVNYIPFHAMPSKFDDSLLIQQISYCRQEHCDFIILCLHWGIEFEFFPRPEQRDITHKYAELGVDLILSHHTHCIQPYEWYQTRRDPLRIVPIFYGLGNLAAIMWNPHTTLSLIIQFQLAIGRINQRRIVLPDWVQIYPVFQRECESTNVNQIHDIIQGDQRSYFLQLEHLTRWVNISIQDPEMRQYIRMMTEYADFVLGTGWRSHIEHD